MTIEERTLKLVELKEKAETLCAEFNEVQNAEKVDSKKLAELDAQITEAVGDYTNHVRTICFQTCKDSGNPMLTAVTMVNFVTITTKDTMLGDDKDIPHREIVFKEMPIDLLKLQKFCGKNIGFSKDWYEKLQKFNFLMTIWVSKDLGIEVTAKSLLESYQMSENAKKVAMGGDPTSRTSRLKALQTVVTAMLGDEYRPISKHIGFIDQAYAKRNNKKLHTVSVSNHKTLMGLVVDVCNSVVTHAGYSVEYKQAKAKETKAEAPKAETKKAEAPKKEEVKAA